MQVTFTYHQGLRDDELLIYYGFLPNPPPPSQGPLVRGNNMRRVGQNRMYIYTVHDRVIGDFPAKITVYTPYIYTYMYGAGQPYSQLQAQLWNMPTVGLAKTSVCIHRIHVCMCGLGQP